MYRHIYTLLASSVEHVKKNWPIVEIGAGPGLAKLFVDDRVTTDIEPNGNIDICLDATRLPFQTESIARLLIKVNPPSTIPGEPQSESLVHARQIPATDIGHPYRQLCLNILSWNIVADLPKSAYLRMPSRTRIYVRT